MAWRRHRRPPRNSDTRAAACRPLPASSSGARPRIRGACSSRRAPTVDHDRATRRRNRRSSRLANCVSPSHAGKADPGVDRRKFLKEAGEDHCLAQTGQGLARDEIRAGPRQNLEARAVKIRELPVAHGVPSPVFGAVGEHGAVRSDGCRHERTAAGNRFEGSAQNSSRAAAASATAPRIRRSA